MIVGFGLSDWGKFDGCGEDGGGGKFEYWFYVFFFGVVVFGVYVFCGWVGVYLGEV